MNNSAIIEKEISTNTLINAAINTINQNNLIYVCSPLQPYGVYTEGDNIRRAQYYCRELTLEGKHPLAPHIYFTTFLNDYDVYEREIGIQLGLKWLMLCSEMNVYINNGYISEGMRKEIELAKKMGIKINYINEYIDK